MFFVSLFFVASFDTAQAQIQCTASNPVFSPSGPQTFDFIRRDNTGNGNHTQPTMQFSFDVENCNGAEVQVIFENNGLAVPGLNKTFLVPNSSTGNGKVSGGFVVGETFCFVSQEGAPSYHCTLTMKVLSNGNEILNTAQGSSAFLSYLCATTGCVTSGINNLTPLTFGSLQLDVPEWTALPPEEVRNYAITRKLSNPIGSTSVTELVRQIVRVIFMLGVPVVSFFIIYSGFLLVTAGGNVEKLKTAKRAFLMSVLGGAVLLGAWVILEALQGTINQIRGV